MAALDALKMYGEGTIRVLSLIPKAIGFDLSKNKYFQEVSGEIMGAPIRNFRNLASTELAKRAVVFSAISFGLVFAAEFARGGKAPSYYNTIMGVVSPFQYTSKNLVENVKESFAELKTWANKKAGKTETV